MTNPESTHVLHQALLERVKLAAQAAGVRAFDWDLVGNHLTLGQTEAYSDDVRGIATNPADGTVRPVLQALPHACSASRST